MKDNYDEENYFKVKDKKIDENLEFLNNINWWIATDNLEKMKAHTHFVWDIIPAEAVNGSIDIPTGYDYVSSEPIYEKFNNDSTIIGIKYTYVNTVDVEAAEYINKITGEIGYPFAGTPLDLEKALDMPKGKTM